MTTTKIIVCGVLGRMGRSVCEMIKADDRCEISCGIDINADESTALDFPVYNSILDSNVSGDVIIDFSHHTSITDILKYATKTKTPAVICTTGHTENECAMMDEASREVGVFYSRNMSIGINLMIALSKKAASILGDSFDIEIVEEHHNNKLDAPSGTALMIADAVRDTLERESEYVYDRHLTRRKRNENEIGIHSVRGGSIIGEHEIIFAGQNEVLRIHHSAFSREVFAKGALSAALFMKDKEKGAYDMESMLG